MYLLQHARALSETADETCQARGPAIRPRPSDASERSGLHALKKSCGFLRSHTADLLHADLDGPGQYRAYNQPHHLPLHQKASDRGEDCTLLQPVLPMQATRYRDPSRHPSSFHTWRRGHFAWRGRAEYRYSVGICERS